MNSETLKHLDKFKDSTIDTESALYNEITELMVKDIEYMEQYANQTGEK